MTNRAGNKRGMMRPKVWTPSQDDWIHRLKTEGKTFVEIGKVLGRTPDAVKNRFYTVIGAKSRYGGTTSLRFRDPGAAIRGNDNPPADDDHYVQAVLRQQAFTADAHWEGARVLRAARLAREARAA